MRIDDFTYTPHYKKSESGSRSRTDFRIHDDDPESQSAADAAVEEVVQLTLGHDGIWEVDAVSEVDEPAARTSPGFSEAFPRVSRLYHSLRRVYSPEGISQALEHSRGMLVDVYV